MSYIGSKPANKPVVASDLDPTVITGQTALAVAPADTDEFLISDAGVLKRLDASLIGGTNTPCFMASCSSNISLANNTLTKAAFSNEVFDVGGVYNTSTYRFTPGFVGKSFISSAAWSYDVNQYQYWIGMHFYKNGSEVAEFSNAMVGGERFERMYITGNLIVAHDADDYYEVFFIQKQRDSSAVNLPTGSGNNAIFKNHFSGYKIIE